MQGLTQQDFISILELIQKLHECKSVESFPTHVLSLLPKVVDSEITVYSEHDPKNGSATWIVAPPGIEPSNSEEISQQFYFEHPLINHLLQTRNGRAFKISDFLTEKEFHPLPGVYKLSFQPIGVKNQMGFCITPIFNLLEQNSLDSSYVPLIHIRIHRNQRNFSERDRLILNLLRPHIFQAYQNAKAFSTSQTELDRLLLEEQILSFSAQKLELLGLTKRQAEILFYVARGKTNIDISSVLGISSGTVKKHLERIYQKLGVQSRATAVTFALERLGILN